MPFSCPWLVVTRLTGGSLQYATTNLGDGGAHCNANMGTYQGCVMLMVIMVVTGVGALTAVTLCVMELIRIRRWRKTRG